MSTKRFMFLGLMILVSGVTAVLGALWVTQNISLNDDGAIDTDSLEGLSESELSEYSEIIENINDLATIAEMRTGINLYVAEYGFYPTYGGGLTLPNVTQEDIMTLGVDVSVLDSIIPLYMS